MATFIKLTAEEADQVRGPALVPIERLGGVFVLNEIVLDDPTHEEHHEFLSGLPRIDQADLPAALEVLE
jgi:hypothetical protein